MEVEEKCAGYIWAYMLGKHMEVVSHDESKFKCRFYNRWNPDIGAESVPTGLSMCKPGLH